MEDKSSHHSDNKDRDSVSENGSSDNKILVTDLDYDIKGGTKQSSPLILSPLANTINNITDNNSNLHSMSSLDPNLVVGSFCMAYNDTDSDTIDIKSNDNCTPMKTLLGKNIRRKSSNILKYYPKGGASIVPSNASQNYVNHNINEIDDGMPHKIPTLTNNPRSLNETDMWF